MSPVVAWILILGVIAVAQLSAFAIRARLRVMNWDPDQEGRAIDDGLRRPYPPRG